MTLQQKLFAAQGIPWASTANGGQTQNMTDPWSTSQTIKYSKPPTPFSSDVSNYNYPSVTNNLYQFGGNFTTPYTLGWTIGRAPDRIAGEAIDRLWGQSRVLFRAVVRRKSTCVAAQCDAAERAGASAAAELWRHS